MQRPPVSQRMPLWLSMLGLPTNPYRGDGCINDLANILCVPFAIAIVVQKNTFEDVVGPPLRSCSVVLSTLRRRWFLVLVILFCWRIWWNIANFVQSSSSEP